MSDVLTQLTAQDEPVAKEITKSGKAVTVWFRKISAGQRERVLEGTSVSHQQGKAGTIEIDLGKNERQRQLMVMYSVCDEKGTRLFKDIKSVAALQSDTLAALYDHADAHNKESDEDLGKP